MKVDRGREPSDVAEWTPDPSDARATTKRIPITKTTRVADRERDIDGPMELVAHPPLDDHQPHQEGEQQHRGDHGKPHVQRLVLIVIKGSALDRVELSGCRQHAGAHEVVGLGDIRGSERVEALSFVERRRRHEPRVDGQIDQERSDRRERGRVTLRRLRNRGELVRSPRDIGEVRGLQVGRLDSSLEERSRRRRVSLGERRVDDLGVDQEGLGRLPKRTTPTHVGRRAPSAAKRPALSARTTRPTEKRRRRFGVARAANGVKRRRRLRQAGWCRRDPHHWLRQRHRPPLPMPRSGAPCSGTDRLTDLIGLPRLVSSSLHSSFSLTATLHHAGNDSVTPALADRLRPPPVGLVDPQRPAADPPRTRELSDVPGNYQPFAPSPSGPSAGRVPIGPSSERSRGTERTWTNWSCS